MVVLQAQLALRQRHFHLSHKPFIALFVLIYLDVICVLRRQPRWMRILGKAVSLRQEGALNYHIQGCVLHERHAHT